MIYTKKIRNKLGKRPEHSIQEVALSNYGFYLHDEARHNQLMIISGDMSLVKAAKY
jgi:hypothetical protein